MDQVLVPRWVVPVEPHGSLLTEHAVVLSGGAIAAVAPVAEAMARFQNAQRLDLPEHVLIPGLVNLHTHAAMTLLRGFADDLPLMDWLQTRIWPAERKFASAAFVREGTMLACAEMLRGGVTCFNDMYFFPEAAAQAALTMGVRAALGIIAIEFPTAYAADADDYLTKGLQVRDNFKGEELVSFCMAPHAPYTVSDRTFLRVVTLAEQLGVPIHMHVHETRSEIAESQAQSGERPLARLRRLGLLGPNLIAVHGCHLEEGELAVLADNACSLAHCPTSNMKLASGIAPVVAARSMGVRVGLGTDGAASNNRLDMFQEMRHAALLGKVASGDPAALDAHSVLRMATLDGAAALGLDERIGSIVTGKRADLCAVRLSGVEASPCFDPVSHLIYAVGREHVSHVWVDGQLRVHDGKLLHAHNAELLDVVDVWQNRLRM